MFLEFVDAFNISSKNTNYYLKSLNQVIKDEGEENVIRMVTDNNYN